MAPVLIFSGFYQETLVRGKSIIMCNLLLFTNTKIDWQASTATKNSFFFLSPMCASSPSPPRKQTRRVRHANISCPVGVGCLKVISSLVRSVKPCSQPVSPLSCRLIMTAGALTDTCICCTLLHKHTRTERTAVQLGGASCWCKSYTSVILPRPGALWSFHGIGKSGPTTWPFNSLVRHKGNDITSSVGLFPTRGNRVEVQSHGGRWWQSFRCGPELFVFRNFFHREDPHSYLLVNWLHLWWNRQRNHLCITPYSLIILTLSLVPFEECVYPRVHGAPCVCMWHHTQQPLTKPSYPSSGGTA